MRGPPGATVKANALVIAANPLLTEHDPSTVSVDVTEYAEMMLYVVGDMLVKMKLGANTET